MGCFLEDDDDDDDMDLDAWSTWLASPSLCRNMRSDGMDLRVVGTICCCRCHDHACRLFLLHLLDFDHFERIYFCLVVLMLPLLYQYSSEFDYFPC